MSEVEPALLDRIERFLAKFSDTPQQVCLECLTEFGDSVRRCADCGSPLVAGPRAIQELQSLLARGRAQQRAQPAGLEPAPKLSFGRPLVPERASSDPVPADELDDSAPERAPGQACPTCGTAFDPESDVEGCEVCRQRVLAEADETEQELAPDPQEVEHVRRLARFLAGGGDPALRYCPGCFAEFLPEANACPKCTKEVLSLEDARALAQRAIADISSHWFVPILEDQEQMSHFAVASAYLADRAGGYGTGDLGVEFSGRLFEALEGADDPPPLEVRPHRELRNFSAILGVWRSYKTIYFVRRGQLPAFRRWLASADLGKEFVEPQQALLERIDYLLDPVRAMT